jgi:hypothetical protein
LETGAIHDFQLGAAPQLAAGDCYRFPSNEQQRQSGDSVFLFLLRFLPDPHIATCPNLHGHQCLPVKTARPEFDAIALKPFLLARLTRTRYQHGRHLDRGGNARTFPKAGQHAASVPAFAMNHTEHVLAPLFCY